MIKNIFLFVFLLLNACQPQGSVQKIGTGQHSYTTWVGKWTGVEGTYLNIMPNGQGIYKIEISDLDGPRSFDGGETADGIGFIRDGIKEIIHAGTGADTGMKWLAGKQDCLIVRANEGYCRD